MTVIFPSNALNQNERERKYIHLTYMLLYFCSKLTKMERFEPFTPPVAEIAICFCCICNVKENGGTATFHSVPMCYTQHPQ